MIDLFLYTHSIHDIPYIEWIHMAHAEREAAVPGYAKGPPVVTKNIPVGTEIQTVAVAHATQAQQMLDWARLVPVTMANVEVVGDVLTGAIARAKVVEAELRKITKPQNDAIKAVRAFFNPVLKTYEDTEKILRQKIKDARNAQIVVNTQATQTAAVALAQGDARGAALAANVIENTALPSNMSSRDNIEFEITDESLVPRELCEPSTKKIRAWIALHGEKVLGVEVPGLRIARGSTLVVRTAT